jgi:hypothetical protein
LCVLLQEFRAFWIAVVLAEALPLPVKRAG